MTKYEKGRNFEYRIVEVLRDEGFLFVSRLPGSKHFDIIAWNGNELYLIECKSGGYSKSEIEKKSRDALEVGANFRFYWKDKDGKICMEEVKSVVK